LYLDALKLLLFFTCFISISHNRDSVHAYVEAFRKDDKPRNVNQGGGFNGMVASNGGPSSGYGMGQSNSPMDHMMGKRKKRTSEIERVEMTPVDFTKTLKEKEDVVSR
jgi:hypothetical protein